MIFFTLILSLVLVVPAALASSDAPATIAAPAKNLSFSAEQLAWSPERRLSWEDFKATPDASNAHHAMTAANLAVDAKCDGNTF